MGLPTEFKTERLEYLKRKAEICFPDNFESLADDDFIVLGKYIQTYSYIELNINRLFNTLKNAGVIKVSSNDRVSIPFIIKKLIFSVHDYVHSPSDIKDVIEKLDEIKFRRDYRNIFAHWAAKKIPDENGIIFLTGDSNDYKKIFGEKMPHGSISYVVFDTNDINSLCSHMASHEAWIAHFCSAVFDQYNS
ncbi:hypothetical protein [Pantoea agglomerans]|uniref:hypothetical protein n=1 Tax=Enterobacter agglomerans TaxID=549 RepID=UPI001654ADB0|nr:hypothetical protein [Pantoea agglomerans]